MFKKNTAVTGFTVGLVSATDGSDITTGTPVGYYTLDGGTQTAIGDVTPVHEGNGQWSFDLTAGEMNGDIVGLTFTHTSAISQHFTIKTDTKIVSELQDLTAAQVNTEVDTGITDAALATAANLATAQADLDIITDTDGVILGAAGVDLIWDEPLTGGTHNIGNSSGRRLRTLQDNGVYALASVWVDEVGGTSTGTTDYEDATVTNRANDFDNAQTVADSVGLTSIQVTNGNTITLTAGLEGYNLNGNGSSLALGGQNIGGTVIKEFGSITGISGTTANPAFFQDCLFGSATIPPCVIQRGGFDGTLTLSAVGEYTFTNCYSTIAGATGLVIDAGSPATATEINVRSYEGGITINNLNTNCTVTLGGTELGGLTLNGADATVEIRGIYKSLTNNLTGSPTVNTDGAILASQIDTITGADGVTLASSQPNSLTFADITFSAGGATPNFDFNGTGSGDVFAFTRSGSGDLYNAAYSTDLQAEVNAACDTALTDYDAATGTELAATEAKIDIIDTNVDAVLVDTGTTIPAQITALNDISVADVLTTQMTEAYAADGTAPTLAEAIFLINSVLNEFAIVGTTITSYKLDGTTVASTHTLDSSTVPTSRTRSS